MPIISYTGKPSWTKTVGSGGIHSDQPPTIKGPKCDDGEGVVVVMGVATATSKGLAMLLIKETMQSENKRSNRIVAR